MTTTSVMTCDGCGEPIVDEPRKNPYRLAGGPSYEHHDFHKISCLVHWLADGHSNGEVRTTDRIEAAIQALHAADIPGLGDDLRNAVVDKLRASLGVYPTPPPGRPPVPSVKPSGRVVLDTAGKLT